MGTICKMSLKIILSLHSLLTDDRGDRRGQSNYTKLIIRYKHICGWLSPTESKDRDDETWG